MNQAAILELMLAVLPYANQIANIDLEVKGQVRFDWRGTRYKVDDRLRVDEVRGRLLHGTDAAMLMGELLKKARDEREKVKT